MSEPLILKLKRENKENQQKIQQNTTNIELLKQENIELKAKDIELEEENKRLREDLNNTVPSMAAEGENVTLKGTANARFKKFEVGGNSWQETRSGKNLLPSAKKETKTSFGATVSCNGEGLYTISGTPTEATTIAFDLNKTITFPSEESLYVNLFNSVAVGEKYLVVLLDTDGNIITGYSMQDVNKKLKSTSIVGKTVKQIRFNFYAGETVNYTVAPTISANAYLEEFEQYGAMPSTEFESPIKNVSGSASFKIVNKNLIQIDKTIFPFSINGLDFSLDKDGNLVVNGTSSAYTEVVLFGNDKDYFLKLFKGKFYKFNNGTTNNNLSMYYSGEKVVQFNNGTAKKIDKDIRVSVLRVQVPTANITFVNEVFKLQFEEVESLSSPATDYTPHQSQNFTFPLAEGQRLMKNDYLADDGIHHKMKRFILTGNEDIIYQIIDNTEFGRLAVNLQNLSQCDITHEIAYSNMFKLLNVGETYALKEGFTVINNAIWIYADKWKNSSLADVRAEIKALYEAGTPLYFDITLTEEEIEAYTPEQQAVYDEIKKTAHSYGEQTHIFSTDEISPIFDVEANADIQSMFNNLQAQILAGEV